MAEFKTYRVFENTFSLAEYTQGEIGDVYPKVKGDLIRVVKLKRK